MAQSNGALIRVENLHKVFVTEEVETHALAGIHLSIGQGEYVSIAGPSGCGKSTLMAILGLLDSPTEGDYWLSDEPVANLSASQRARIRNRQVGFIFQSFNLIGDLTVYENVELPLTYRGMPSAERKQRTQEALERVGMSHRMKHYPAQLSGGQQQRVAVARAVVGRAVHPAGRRAHRQPRLQQRRRGHGAAGASCTARAPRSAWSRTTPATPRHAQRTVHLFDGRIVEEEEAARRQQESAELKQSGFDVA